EKMICRILLLITLTSCVCGTFVVNVTQSSYQAEENQNITLEWTFTIKKERPLTTPFLSTDESSLTKTSSGEGRIRLHVSRLRTDDSGLYLCEVKTNYGFNIGKSRLNVTGKLISVFCMRGNCTWISFPGGELESQ
ncbi:hypothetical protein L3Q82_016594, partial [Scortum barcoo]